MAKKTFKILVYAVAVIFMLLNVFTYCSTGKYIETPPAYSNTKTSDWYKLKPKTYNGFLEALDTLLTPGAKDFFKNADEVSSVVLMGRRFGWQVSSWRIAELDYTPEVKNNFLSNPLYLEFTYRVLNEKILCLGYYRHLNQLPFNIQAAKDSIIKRFPPERRKGNTDIVNYNLVTAEQDSVENRFYLSAWEINDTVKGYYGITSKKLFREFESGNFSGRIVSKNSLTGKVEIMIDTLYFRDKKIETITDPKEPSETYTVGKTIWRKPTHVTNINKNKYY
jgi:hypothetical protein